MILKRLKNIWRLSEYRVNEADMLTPTIEHGQLASKVTTLTQLTRDIPLGDGQAAFLGEGTHEEFEEQKREDKGIRGIFGL